MNRRLAISLLWCAACGSTASPTTPELPWIQGFAASAASDILTPSASDRAGIIQVTGDVAPAEGDETVVVSYAGGVIVRDRSGAVIARAPGFGESGSSDDLVAVGIGDGAIGLPLIVVAINQGGHRMGTTSLALYRVGERGRVDRVFFGPIEERDGDQTVTGSIRLLPGSLLYRAPLAPAATVWTFDRARRQYVVATDG